MNLCIGFGGFCRVDHHLCQNRSAKCQFGPGDGDSDDRDCCVCLGIVIARGQTGGLAQLNPQTILFLTLSGLATGASWLLYFHALQLGNASLVAGVDKLSLVLIVVFSALFLAEPLTWRVVLGAGMITLGTLVLIRQGG